jgi:hypothetical protein
MRLRNHHTSDVDIVGVGRVLAGEEFEVDEHTGDDLLEQGYEPVGAPNPGTYKGWKLDALTAELALRNDGRDEDKQITPTGEHKADLIAALEADDAERENA